jgi:hypothetical protein
MMLVARAVEARAVRGHAAVVHDVVAQAAPCPVQAHVEVARRDAERPGRGFGVFSVEVDAAKDLGVGRA